MADNKIDPGPPLVSMAQQFKGLPMYALIGNPLMAAAKANGMMAVTQTKFLIDTCFYPDPKGGDAGGNDPDKPHTYLPIMIEMVLERAVISPPDKPGEKPTIETFKTKFDLPLLTILPLNSLAVETVDVDFNMQVKSSYSEEQTEKSEESFKVGASWQAKVGWGPLSASTKGSVSFGASTSQSDTKHYEKSNSAEYSVKVHAGQLPLPPGVSTIIQAFTDNIAPIEFDTGSSGGGGG